MPPRHHFTFANLFHCAVKRIAYKARNNLWASIHIFFANLVTLLDLLSFSMQRCFQNGCNKHISTDWLVCQCNILNNAGLSIVSTEALATVGIVVIILSLSSLTFNFSFSRGQQPGFQRITVFTRTMIALA